MIDTILWDAVNAQRKAIKAVAADVKHLHGKARTSAASPGEDGQETLDNLKLAYRHLEDASMRLGKALQAIDGGVSVYDRATTVGA